MQDPIPLFPKHLDQPVFKWLPQKSTFHFGILLWGKTLPTVQGQGPLYDQEKNPKRILYVFAMWHYFPTAGFQR